MTHFRGSSRDEISELRNELNNAKLDRRKSAVKRVIAAMTLGKDVSVLFSHVLKCVETQDLELKKLVYLYIINYAKSQPDLTLMAINTFRKDSTGRMNPLIRGLAVRTMGCIGITKMFEYLIDPLKDASNDEDPYVRKTAAICIAKLFEIDPDRALNEGLIQRLQDMINDGNGMVVSNAVAALTEISNTKGKFIKMTPTISHKLLNALPEVSEWGRVYILDFLADYPISEQSDETIQRVIPNLAHRNPAVVLSATKVILKYMEFVQDADKLRSISRKMAPPLISLMNNEPEIQYIAIRNINLIIQKRPYIFEKEVKVFFCNFQDPLYVKLEKLELMTKLADLTNVDQLLVELKDYSQEIDVQFVRKAISAIGRIAIKLERAAARCVQALHELIRTRISYVVQEVIIVVKDIFRQYPGKYENIIRDLCDNLKSLDNADSRASMIWIIGEYGERIDNAVDLMTQFSENFKEEARQVQMAILTASVKLYLQLEDEAEDLITEVLKISTDESDNPDLRNRGYIYWRMLSENPEEAKAIVLCKKPPISEDVSNIEDRLLDKLFDNLSMLASVYYKPPENFVKKIRDRINERMDLEDHEDNGNNPDYVDSTGLKRSDYLKDTNTQQESYTAYMNNDLLDMGGSDNNQQKVNTQGLDDILGPSNTNQQTQQNPSTNSQSNNLLDIDNMLDARPNPQQQNTNSLLDLDLGNSQPNVQTGTPIKYCRVPEKVVVASSKTGQKGNSGMQIEAALQRQDQQTYVLEMKIKNETQADLKNFQMKFNNNYYGLQTAEKIDQGFVVPVGQTGDYSLKCSVMTSLNEDAPKKPPIMVQVGLFCSLDVFYLEIPVLGQTLFQDQLSPMETAQFDQMWASIASKPEWNYNQPRMGNNVGNPQLLKERMSQNNIHFLKQYQGPQGQALFQVYASTPKKEVVMGEVCIYQGKVTLQAKSQTEFIIPFFLQGLSFVLQANA